MPDYLLVILCSTILCVSGADTENPGDADKPWVSFVPDCRKMFYNETLTVGCLGGKGSQTYTWYRNNIKMNITEQNFTVSSIQLYNRANYQCQIGNNDRSDPFRQHVTNDLTILRVPRLVFEGDILALSCDSRPDVNTTNSMVTFYKNNEYLTDTSSETSLFIGKVDSGMSGKYKCTKTGRLLNTDKETYAEEEINIAELFSPPELVIKPNPIQVGSNMILTCVTKLHPLRASTGLQFAFYKNGWHVQEFSSNNYFTILSVKMEDSGDYSCEVKTPTNSVKKMSKLSSVQVQVDERPGVTFNPNHDKILRTEYITMSCEGSANTGKLDYTWYKNNKNLFTRGKYFSVFSANDGDIGIYQCQAGASEKSDPVHLDVVFAKLILQVPIAIHEGDNVRLVCHVGPEGRAQNTTFYKDDQMIEFYDQVDHTDLLNVTRSTSGKYKCTRFINTDTEGRLYTAEESISVADLFSQPEIKVGPYSMIEGADMTLTCLTALSPLRRNTKLLFEFYKNGKTVQSVSSSDKYKVHSVQPEDSGNYTCKVQNEQGSVSKLSNPTSVQIKGTASVAFTPKIFTGDSITLTCNVDSIRKGNQNFNWYRDSMKLKETQQSFTIGAASVEDSGYYQCQSSVSHLSEAIRLDVSNSELILQTPPIIHEGDDLILQCHQRRRLWSPAWVLLYKEGNVKSVAYTTMSSIRLGKASREMNGSYRCTKELTAYRAYRTYTFVAVAEAFVSVTDTFPYVKLKASRDLVIEGDPVVLSCQTALNSALSTRRGKTKLQFAFYKDGKNIVAFSTSDTYMISSSAEKQHSGNYTCEVKSSTNGVTKMSPALSVDVEDLFSAPVLKEKSNTYIQGSLYLFSCETTLHPKRQTTELEYSFYKDEECIQENSFFLENRFIDTVHNDSAGNYSCEVTSPAYNVVKRSSKKNIQVQDTFPYVQLKASRDLVIEGDPVVLSCETALNSALSTLHGKTELQFAFYKDGKNLVAFNTSKTYNISSAEKQHSGNYTCEVKSFTNGVTKMSPALSVDVEVPVSGIEMTMEEGEQEIQSGASVSFRCSVEFGSAISITWFHNSKEVDQNCILYEIKEDGKMLLINPVQPHHSGSYHCKATNAISSITSNSTAISVIDPIRDVTLTIDNGILETRSGESLTFSCVAAKNATSTVVWLHNGMKLDEISETHEVKDNGKLLYIKSLDVHHGGQYQCLTIQYISTRELKSHSNILNIHVSEKTSAHLIPSLIAVVLVVAAIFTSIVVYKYRHRQTMSKSALQPKNIQVYKGEEDYLLCMENVDNAKSKKNGSHNK